MATNIPTVEDLKEFLPIPANIGALTDPDKVDVAQSITEKPTASHALAMADHHDKGAAQETHDDEVKDLGWADHVDQMQNPLVGGMHNEDLWVLVRRFNKVNDIDHYPYPVPGNLDLNIADEEEFSPDKLRANIERLYMTVIIGLMGATKQIMRLRSWRETRRTTCFCAAYFIAWAFDFLTPLFLSVVIALIVYPPCRDILFPPAPLALVSASTGGVQKPKAGVLGSTDSATGAPEKHKGEAVEAEASNVVNSIASVALSSVAGKHPQNEPPHAENSRGNDSDKTRVPMETAIWNNMRPIMHGIADVSDTWERFGNALSPTPPFPRDLFRLRIAAVVVPLLGVSIFVTSYMLVKGITFGVGFGFFGDPLIQRGLVWLNSHFPKWQKLLELRNTLLKGVPTNAQLTITLLRIGEANKAPIPPPPLSHGPPPDEPVELTEDELRAAGADWPLNATDEEIKAAIEPDPTTAHETAGTDIDESKKKSHGKAGAKILGFLKGNVKASVDTALGVDHLKAKAGSEPSKQRLGVIPPRNESKLSGPIDFKCRYHGKRGHAYIATKATIPCIGFSLDKNITSKDGSGLNSELHPVWTVALADIKELKKLGGLGWKSKLVVGWALDREVADGLEIVDKLGNHWILTAMVLRDELFNRLVAMGGQKWEAW
ncbi:uncharacterized protein MYCFIDRAFT_125916 [Pseudocercospora fijiensis CIRAD86]|uniref:Uncharacterized protein n=1 Tax=Pseudocercospora fijiensis (strain CIRAD86) TaxID=383855 RepID=N1QAH3_PSEFD|nr:uncharacterized protein MYCFIDRAFT_125916 [Pseudocercospora fijiensis CIRAD86]EME88861.1 hypothetical protein MYCFIDRAFT_125916 [Pseudocercospora fijiensis CIRAD86]